MSEETMMVRDEEARLAALVEVRRAVVAERAAREDAEAARERLRQAALDAVDAGATASEVARLAGVRRATIYVWRESRPTWCTPSLTVDIRKPYTRVIGRTSRDENYIEGVIHGDYRPGAHSHRHGRHGHRDRDPDRAAERESPPPQDGAPPQGVSQGEGWKQM